MRCWARSARESTPTTAYCASCAKASTLSRGSTSGCSKASLTRASGRRSEPRPEFEQAINAAAADTGLNQQFVEKDYWVTTILRIVVAELPGKTTFKGGTSLSKGWSLIDRFSEDIDLFVDPAKFDPKLGKNGVTRVLKALRDKVAAHPGLTLLEGGNTINGFSREDTFEYETRYAELPGVPATVRLEPGIQSGKQPIQTIALNSIVASFLMRRGQSGVADDLQPFDMALLHFRRTFVEKLFTIHSKIERLKADGTAVGRDARHYADLHALASQDDVIAMLNSPEYDELKLDYDKTSRVFFPKTYRPPNDLSFNKSDALFPSSALRAQIEKRLHTRVRRAFRRTAPSDPHRCPQPSRNHPRPALAG